VSHDKKNFGRSSQFEPRTNLIKSARRGQAPALPR
jgi:hypothetical protein